MRLLLFTLLLLSLLFVGCGDSPEKKEKIVQPAPVKEKPEVQKPVVKKEEQPPADPLEKAPPQNVPPQGMPKVLDDIDIVEQEWNQARSFHVSQFIDNPDSIVWGLKRPIKSDMAEYLDRGYGMLYSSSGGVAKDLEYGLLKARSQDAEALETSLKNLEEQGMGGNYYLLVYISTWYYALNNQPEKAKQLAEKTNLFANIENFQLTFPNEHVEQLKGLIGQK